MVSMHGEFSPGVGNKCMASMVNSVLGVGNKCMASMVNSVLGVGNK